MKRAYEIPGHPGLVALVMKAPPAVDDADQLNFDIEDLSQLAKWGFPIVPYFPRLLRVVEKGKVTRWALIKRKLAASLKDQKSLEYIRPATLKFAREINERLRAYRVNMDLGPMIDASGKLYLDDPFVLIRLHPEQQAHQETIDIVETANRLLKEQADHVGTKWPYRRHDNATTIVDEVKRGLAKTSSKKDAERQTSYWRKASRILRHASTKPWWRRPTTRKLVKTLRVAACAKGE